MGPKKNTKGGGEVVKQEDVTVAVLIADSFNVRFAPLTEKRPKVNTFRMYYSFRQSKNCNNMFPCRLSFPLLIDP